MLKAIIQILCNTWEYTLYNSVKTENLKDGYKHK